MPHKKDEATNRAVDQRNRRTSPRRRLSQPVAGRTMALATLYEVMTQVPWEAEAPRLPAMVGTDTLAMVVSSTCMKVAKGRATVKRARDMPERGGNSRSAAMPVAPCRF